MRFFRYQGVSLAAALITELLASGSRAEIPRAALRSPSGFVLVQQKQSKAPDAAGRESKPIPAPAAGIPAQPGPTAAVGEFQPVLHAQGAKITTCMDTIVGEAASVIDGPHTAISSWSQAAPNDNAFVSIIGLSYASKAAPNAAAVMFAAPLGSSKCAGGTVQIYPVAQPCSALQAKLIDQGHTVAMLQALPVVETKAGLRNVLIPTAGGGCVLLAVGLRE